LRSIGPLAYLPISDARSARPAESYASVGRTQNTGASATIVLPQARPVRSLPFLAQYLAQEIMGPDDAAPRWAERDNSYRTAAASDPHEALFSVEA
jgi:hypothetical protein